MKTIRQEDYTKLNAALYHLEDILECMGVKEFSLSRENHKIQLDTDGTDVDTELLILFCRNIERIHREKFGQNYAA